MPSAIIISILDMKRLAQSILIIYPSHTVSNKILVSRLPAKIVNAYQWYPFNLSPFMFMFMLCSPSEAGGQGVSFTNSTLTIQSCSLRSEMIQRQQFAELVFIIYHRPGPTLTQALNSSIDLKIHAINFPPKEEAQAPPQPQFQNVPTD